MRLALLTHDVFDTFRKSGVLTVSEYAVIPACLDSKMIKVNVILKDVVVFAHLEVVQGIFSIHSRINGAKLGAESADELRPVV